MSVESPVRARLSWTVRVAGVVALVCMDVLSSACTSRSVLSTGFVHHLRNSEAEEVVAHLFVDTRLAHDLFPTGLGHYTEHLVFRSLVFAGERSAVQHSNARTYHETLVYSLAGEKSDLVSLLKTLNGVFNPLETAKVVALQERDIVLREYDLRGLGNPEQKAWEATNSFLYRANKLSRTLIGSPADIAGYTPDLAAQFHAQTHKKDRAVWFIQGDISAVELLDAMVSAGIENRQAAIKKPTAFKMAEIDRLSVENPDKNTAARLLWRKVVAMPAVVDFECLKMQARLLEMYLNSKLDGGLAGPLRFDANVCSEFDIAIRVLDERHVELVFTGRPVSGVTLDHLQTSFERELSQALDKVPSSTFARIHRRFEASWPDREDKFRLYEWRRRHIFNRLLRARKPVAHSSLVALEKQIDNETLDAFAKVFQEPGRVASAKIGKFSQ